MSKLGKYRQVYLENLNKVRVPKVKDHRVLLLSNDDSNNGETFRCAEGINQVSCYSCNGCEMFELP